MLAKIFKIISRIAFLLFIVLFISGIFIKLDQRAFVFNSGIFEVLFFTALISECVYQLSSRFKKGKDTRKKKKEFKKLPNGNYKIRDKKSNTNLGILTADEINFLRRKFLDNDMDDNNFYFNSMTFELFKKENPPKQLYDKIKAMLETQDPIEITWEKQN